MIFSAKTFYKVSWLIDYNSHSNRNLGKYILIIKFFNSQQNCIIHFQIDSLTYTVKPVRLHTSLLCTLVYIVHFSYTNLRKRKSLQFTPLYFAHLSILQSLLCIKNVQCTHYTGFTVVMKYLYCHQRRLVTLNSGGGVE